MSESVKLALLASIDTSSVEAMLAEYAAAGEICHPMNFAGDENTTLYAVLAAGELVGVIRVTRELWNLCHGNIGISLRPTARGRGYGSEAINAIPEHASFGKWEPTACIDKNNAVSLRMFRAAGYTETGQEYLWKKHGNTRTAIELRLTERSEGGRGR